MRAAFCNSKNKGETMWYIVIILIIVLFYYWSRIAILENQKRALINSLASAMLSGKTKDSPDILFAKFLDNVSAVLTQKDYNSLVKALAEIVQAGTHKDEQGFLVINQQVWLRDRFIGIIKRNKEIIDKEVDMTSYDVEGY
jgi:hypothetical protein